VAVAVDRMAVAVDRMAVAVAVDMAYFAESVVVVAERFDMAFVVA
jgi:hypothetical protein